MTSTDLSSVPPTVTSLLLPGGGGNVPLDCGVVGADAATTTYELCIKGENGRGDCTGEPFTVKLGPWAEEELPPGEEETGILEFQYATEMQTIVHSVNCEMSRTSAESCYTVIFGDEGELRTTTQDPKYASLFQRRFGYATVTITSGLDKLEATATDTNTASSSEAASGPKETDSKSSDKDSEGGEGNSEDNNEPDDDSSASALPPVIAAPFVACIAAALAL